MIRLTGHAALMRWAFGDHAHSSQQASPEFTTQLRRDLEEFASLWPHEPANGWCSQQTHRREIARNVGWYLAGPCISRLKICTRESGIIISAGLRSGKTNIC